VFDHDKYLKDDQAERRSGETGREIVDPAIEFLKTRKTDKPFLMYLAFANPHDPRGASEKHLKLYDRKSIPLPKNFKPLHPFDNGELLVRDEQLAPWPRTEDEVRKHLHDYYAAISGLDEQIGRLLTTLDDLKLEGNTVVIFSADHGLAIGSHGLFGKQSLYEHSMKAPLIFAGPKIGKSKSDAFAYLHDIFPTACELSGIATPSGLDGVSQASVVRGDKKSTRDVVFTAYRDVQRAVRKDDWKLIVYPKINKTQLFDLKSDPEETKDLSESHAERVKELTAAMRKEQEKYGDSQALTSEKPAKAEVDLSFFKIPPKKK
jgi:arylsulfatase A-like enzyme